MMRMEQERYKMDVDDTVHKLRAMVSELQQEKQELGSQLDHEKRCGIIEYLQVFTATR